MGKGQAATHPEGFLGGDAPDGVQFQHLFQQLQGTLRQVRAHAQQVPPQPVLHVLVAHDAIAAAQHKPALTTPP
jgi:hypothetical protein